MEMKRNWRRAGVLVIALGLVATGCRGGAETASEDTEEEATTSAEDTEATEEASSEESASEGSEEESGSGEIAIGEGVTEEPCPEAVNADNGCIYLGTISDLTAGPFSALGPEITTAQEAFWRTVNEEGGIGGFDVDVTTYVRDNLYNPETHTQVYQEIKPDILALAQTLGSPTTFAIIDDLASSSIVAAPASWTSEWAFRDVIVESGNNYCIESMNGVDYALENYEGIESVMAVHYPGDYGDDAAAGARIASEGNGLTFADVPTTSGQDNQAGAIDALVTQAPDLVFITTGPTDMATIVGQAAARGFTGRVIGTSPTWNPGIVGSPAFRAVEQLYIQSGPWASYEADTPGHQAMRDALGDVQGNDGLTSGWVWSYPLRAALEAAAEAGDLTREGLLEAVTTLEEVDYQGMLPEGAGNYGAEPNEAAVRGTVFSRPDAASATGVTLITEEFFTGPTAESYELSAPCYE